MKRVVLPLLALPLLAACGDGEDPQAPEPGSFQAAVSGAVRSSFRGDALFGPSTGVADESFFAIVLLSRDSTELIGLVREGDSLPAAGTYRLELDSLGESASGWTAVYSRGSGTEIETLFFASSGTVRITVSETGRMEGSFEFAADEFLPFEDAPPRVSVAGSFAATHYSTAPRARLSAARGLASTALPLPDPIWREP